MLSTVKSELTAMVLIESAFRSGTSPHNRPGDDIVWLDIDDDF